MRRLNHENFYIPLSFGDVYFNPATHEAVIEGRDGNFIVAEMDEKYSPRDFPKTGVREYEVADDVFPKLYAAALRFMSSERDLREALSHFPKD